jgi:hypothetical protein
VRTTEPAARVASIDKVNLLIQRYFSQQSAIPSPPAGRPGVMFAQACLRHANFFVEPIACSPVEIGQGADK